MPDAAICLDNYTLKKGGHNTFEEGYCAMELAAHLAGEPHSDTPQCVCPVIAAYVRSWQDAMPDDLRQELVLPLVPRLLKTRSTPEVQDRRAILVADWCERVVLPIWLELTPSLRSHAAALRAMPEATTVEQLKNGERKVLVAAAWDAARAAAWDAARDAAGAAAWDAARAAAGAAARAAARAAAGAAAWAAAWDAAGAAARDAARDAAGAAAWDAAGAAAGAAARDAAWAAAWDAARDAAGAAAGAAARDAAGAAAGAALQSAKIAIWRATPAMIERLPQEK